MTCLCESTRTISNPNLIDSVKLEISSFLLTEKLVLPEASAMFDILNEIPKKMPWNTSEMESNSTVKRLLLKKLHQEVTLKITEVDLTIEVVDSEIEVSMIGVVTDSIITVVDGETIEVVIGLMIGEEVIGLMIDEVATDLMIDEVVIDLMIDEEGVPRRLREEVTDLGQGPLLTGGEVEVPRHIDDKPIVLRGENCKSLPKYEVLSLRSYKISKTVKY